MTKIRVWLDDQPYDVLPGSTVKDLLRLAGKQGTVRDAKGHELGSHGELVPEQRLTCGA